MTPAVKEYLRLTTHWLFGDESYDSDEWHKLGDKKDAAFARLTPAEKDVANEFIQDVWEEWL